MLQPTRNPNRRTASPINSKLEKKLSAYIAAAGAAGVGMLAVTQPAEAKVVYTSANIPVFTYGYGDVALDINGDGVTDLTFFGATFAYGTYLKVYAPAGNGIAGANFNASALKWGARIGPKAAFTSKAQNIASVGGCHSSNCGYYGPWDNTQGHFLGVKFVISGEVHYGWLRLNVAKRPYHSVITGYAYETIPNKPIIAGAESGPQVAGAIDSLRLAALSMQPPSLGMLARGADGLAVWRRKEDSQS
jgi:hypothetical protein